MNLAEEKSEIGCCLPIPGVDLDEIAPEFGGNVSSYRWRLDSSCLQYGYLG